MDKLYLIFINSISQVKILVDEDQFNGYFGKDYLKVEMGIDLRQLFSYGNEKGVISD